MRAVDKIHANLLAGRLNACLNILHICEDWPCCRSGSGVEEIGASSSQSGSLISRLRGVAAGDLLEGPRPHLLDLKMLCQLLLTRPG